MAQHGLPVHYRADPARSRMQLLPLPGICPATVAVAVSTHATHTGVSRRPNCAQLNYHSHSSSHRETQPHVRTWRPTSPVCTATSHTLFSHTQHTVAHSPVPHTHTPHPRGHSPAVSHTHVGVRTRVPSLSHTRPLPPAVPHLHRGVNTHVPPPARTWFLPTAVPLSHTACREARTPAHS